MNERQTREYEGENVANRRSHVTRGERDVLHDGVTKQRGIFPAGVLVDKNAAKARTILDLDHILHK